MSNAINLKSTGMTATFEFARRQLVMRWSTVIIAAAGDPVGLNEN